MASTLDHLLQSWQGLVVISRYDAATRAWIFIALHDDSLGTPTGGTRIKVYPRPEDGLRDAQRLAEGMTHKWAAVELDFGGGKAVLALSRPLEEGARTGLLERYAHLLNTLHGSFATGQDLGTTPEDMRVLRQITPYVHGLDPGTQTMRDPGPFTAHGVLAGMMAARRHLDRADDLQGCRVLIQGVGDVGGPLARLCADAGAELLLADSAKGRAETLAQELGCAVVPADDVYDTPCDVFAPCAVGAILNRRTVVRLRCRVVAGSANNQLEESDDGERLHRRGILYAPDYVINAGGALAFGLRARGEEEDAVLLRRVHGLEQTLARIFDEAAERAESPQLAAQRHVQRVLEQARRRKARRPDSAELE